MVLLTCPTIQARPDYTKYINRDALHMRAGTIGRQQSQHMNGLNTYHTSVHDGKMPAIRGKPQICPSVSVGSARHTAGRRSVGMMLGFRLPSQVAREGRGGFTPPDKVCFATHLAPTPNMTMGRVRPSTKRS